MAIRPFLLPSEQQRYRYIISVEGNDVATNLKWILNSNSLCLMTKPRFETWFMEGRLLPDVHYAQLADDFSDLEEKIEFFEQNPVAALEIIAKAQAFVAQFQDPRREELIAALVLQKYFEFTDQLPPSQWTALFQARTPRTL